jgi:hypothetical protein
LVHRRQRLWTAECQRDSTWWSGDPQAEHVLPLTRFVLLLLPLPLPLLALPEPTLSFDAATP